MKFFFTFAVVAALASSALAVPGGIVNTGHSAQFRSQDSLGNYAFGYNEDHATGGTFRRETGSPGLAEGSYGLRDIDGRVRVVNYVADGLGFRANIQTNEPGVDPNQDPASVLINKAAAIVAPYLKSAPVPVAAPLAIQQSYEAPVVQKYEAAPIIEQAPVVQRYEQAPLLEQRYEQAPLVEQRYEQAPIIEQAPVVQRYEQAPILEQAPLVQRYEQAPIVEQLPQPALLPTSYTTKTYAAPAPILSAPGPISAGYAHGPLPVASYATKSAPSYGIPSSAILGVKGHLASPVFAAKSLHGLPLIKKK